jgi:archaellum component FlaG (FlaF/FlaG flagellin family)
MLFKDVSYVPLRMVAAVPITPILPFSVRSAAALTGALTTSKTGISYSFSRVEKATEHTVLQAITIAFISNPAKNAAS